MRFFEVLRSANFLLYKTRLSNLINEMPPLWGLGIPAAITQCLHLIPTVNYGLYVGYTRTS